MANPFHRVTRVTTAVLLLKNQGWCVVNSWHEANAVEQAVKDRMIDRQPRHMTDGTLRWRLIDMGAR